MDISRSDPTFLDPILTTDETWVHYYEPEDKKCLVWKNRGSPPPKKAKAVKLMGKVTCVVFMYSSRMILVHMVPASGMVKEAFAWKTISRSREDQIHYPNLNTVWFKEVYEKWVKRHQKCITYSGEYFEKG